MKIEIEDPRWLKSVEAFNSGDHAGALFLLQSLAKDGVSAAYSRLGKMYEHGWGVGVDKKKAYEWYQRGYNKTHDRDSVMGLGKLLFSGEGCCRDYNASFLYFMEGTQFREPEAYYYLGIMYDSGKGVVQNRKRAKALYLRAAAKGHLLALVPVAGMYGKSGHPIKGFCRQLYWLLKGISRNVSEVAQSKNLVHGSRNTAPRGGQ
jgi:TPR repeat protein